MSTTLPRQRTPRTQGTGPPRTLSLPYTGAVAVLAAAATGYGLVAADAYRSVPPLLEQTWRAQDAVTLATLPLLLWAARRARGGSLRAHLLWTGLMAWLAYSYAHLAIGTPFNPVFLAYVALLALSGFAVLDGLLRVDVAAVAPAFTRAPRRAATWFLALAGLGIAGLWLSDVVVGLAGGTPTGLHLADLPNPTWVLDLAWLIPMSLGAARLLSRRHAAGYVVAAALLVMLLVLSVAMLVIAPFALSAGLGDDASVVTQLVVFSVVFTVLGAAEAVLLAVGARRFAGVRGGWLRRGWWTT